MAYQFATRDALKANEWQIVHIPAEGDSYIGKEGWGQQLYPAPGHKLSVVLNNDNSPETNIGTIGQCAFQNEKDIAIIDLKGVRKLGSFALSNSGIESVHFPLSVSEIGSYACSNCSELKNVIIGDEKQPEAKKNIFQKLFHKESAETDPNAHIFNTQTSLEHIPRGCFENSGVETIIIGKGVKTIDEAAFRGCHNLRHIIVCDSTNTALLDQVRNAAMQAENINNLYVSTTPEGYSNTLKQIAAENQTQQIDNISMFNSSDRKADAVSTEPIQHQQEFGYGQIFSTKTLVEKGYAVINENKELMMIKTLPNIDAQIVIDSRDPFTGVRDPNYEIVGLAQNAFIDQTGIRSITIIDPITKIGDNAFLGTGIKEINIPASVSSIGQNICFGCNKLKTATIEDGTKYIPDYTFGNCPNLKNVLIPSSVESIAPSALYNANIQSISGPSHLHEQIKNAARYTGNDSIQIHITGEAQNNNSNQNTVSTGLEL